MTPLETTSIIYRNRVTIIIVSYYINNKHIRVKLFFFAHSSKTFTVKVLILDLRHVPDQEQWHTDISSNAMVGKN